MDVNNLITYLNVIKLGSFSRAAKKLYFSQPGVSFQIKRLEKEIGLVLIEHHKKTIHMTEVGKRVLRFAESVHNEQLNLFHDLEQLQDKLTGNLFVVSSHMIGELVLPAILSAFKLQYPYVGIRLVLSDSVEVINQVSSGLYEIGFGSFKSDNQDLEFFKIGEHEIVLIVSPSHRYALQQEVSFADLTGETIVLREEPSGKARSAVDLVLENGFDISQCDSRLVLGTDIGVVSAVEAGAGIAFTSDLIVKKSVALGTVKVLKIKGLTIKRGVFCIYKKEINSLIYEKFINFIQLYAQKNPVC